MYVDRRKAIEKALKESKYGKSGPSLIGLLKVYLLMKIFKESEE